jgi:hypothetical protein
LLLLLQLYEPAAKYNDQWFDSQQGQIFSISPQLQTQSESYSTGWPLMGKNLIVDYQLFSNILGGGFIQSCNNFAVNVLSLKLDIPGNFSLKCSIGFFNVHSTRIAEYLCVVSF